MNSIKNRLLGAGIAAFTIAAALAAPATAQNWDNGKKDHSGQRPSKTIVRHDGATHGNRTDWQSNSKSHRSYYHSKKRSHNRYIIHHDNGLHKGWDKGIGNQKHYHNHTG
jgi:hypothetical protein